MPRPHDPVLPPALRRLPRTPHPSWRSAANGEASRRKPDAAEFWSRVGG